VFYVEWWDRAKARRGEGGIPGEERIAGEGDGFQDSDIATKMMKSTGIKMGTDSP
jgi:hypothetical protein